MPRLTPYLDSAPCVRKLDHPILTPSDLPYESTLVFNAGVTKFNGKYIMVFRNDYGTDYDKFQKERCFPCTSIGVAISDNGVDGWQVRKEFLLDSHETQAQTGRELRRFYDPRITILEGKPYLTMACDARHGIYGVIAEIDDNFEKVNVISMSVPNNRNMVLFPEKIGGYYYRLERPMAMFGEDCGNYDIWCSKSPDLKFWGESKLICDNRIIPFANDKIGPAAPPIKTKKGWVATYHAVDIDKTRGKNGWEPRWPARYSSGVMLLDLDDPSKLLGISKVPFIAPDMPYETDEGFRQNTVFPGGMILEDDGEVKIYYGAADACECVAFSDVDSIVELCLADN